MKHRLEQPYWGGSCGIDKAGVKTNLCNATLNDKRVWVVRKPGTETKVFDDPEQAEQYFNMIRRQVK
jgi:hypothetical protein